MIKIFKHQIQYVSLGVLMILLNASCSKSLSPSQKDFKQYEMNQLTVADTAIVAMYTPYKSQMQAEMNRVIGFAAQALTKEKSPETLMGNFFTQALMDESEKLNQKADLSFATKGGIRNEIKAGNITVGDIFEVMPFENQLTILELKGEDVQKLADYIALSDGQPILGMTLAIKDKKPIDIKVNGLDIDHDKLYKLVTYDYIANGGDNLALFNKAVNRKDYPVKVRETLMEYISNFTKNGQKITMQLDGRVKIIK